MAYRNKADESENKRLYYLKHKERIRAYTKEWRAKNRESIKANKAAEWKESYSDPNVKAAYLAKRKADYWKNHEKQKARGKEKYHRLKTVNSERDAAYRKQYYAKNKDKFKAKRREPKWAEYYAKYSRSSYQENREKRLTQNKKWQQENAERFKAKKDEYKRSEAGRQSFRKAVEKYRKKNPLKFTEMTARRRAQKKATKVAPIKYGEILAKANGMCGICAEPFNAGPIHFDHIKPLSKGGHHTSDNIQATHAACNLRKNNKYAAV